MDKIISSLLGFIYNEVVVILLVTQELARLLCHWNSPGKNTRLRNHSLLQGIFPTKESNLGFPHCRQILILSGPPRKPQ